MNKAGKHYVLIFSALWLCVLSAPRANAQEPQDLQSAAKQLMVLANEARAAAGKPPLRWDPSLAEAARKHTMRMVAEGRIAHQYPGELNVSERAGLARAHFDLIEENIAIAATAQAIHDG